MIQPLRQLDNVSSTVSDGGRGIQPPLPDFIKPVEIPPSPPRGWPRMPQDRIKAKKLLESVGVDAAVGVAWRFEPAQVKAVVARWEERNADGENLGPGWIVWRLREGPVKAQRQGAATNYLEERYRRGKARLGGE